jgi:hypothetical protein
MKRDPNDVDGALEQRVRQLKGKSAREFQTGSSSRIGKVSEARIRRDGSVDVVVRMDPFYARTLLAGSPGRLSHVVLNFEFKPSGR